MTGDAAELARREPTAAASDESDGAEGEVEWQVLRLEIGADEESRALGSPYRVAEFEAHNPPDETDAEVLAAEEACASAAH